MNPLTTQSEIDTMKVPDKCGNCATPSMGRKLTLGWELHLCDHCLTQFEESEIRDGGPWTVEIRHTMNQHYPIADYNEAKDFARMWRGRMTNSSDHLIFNFEA